MYFEGEYSFMLKNMRGTRLLSMRGALGTRVYISRIVSFSFALGISMVSLDVVAVIIFFILGAEGMRLYISGMVSFSPISGISMVSFILASVMVVSNEEFDVCMVLSVFRIYTK